MKHYWQLVRGLNRDMRLYLLADGLSGFTVDGGIYAVVLNLYLLRLGYGAQFIGAVNGVGLLAYGLFSLAAGWLGSRFRTRRMIALGLVMMAAGGCALPLAEFVAPGLRASWVVASFVITNLGLALHVTNCTPFLTEISQAGERHVFFSIVATAWSLAGFIAAGIKTRRKILSLLANPTGARFSAATFSREYRQCSDGVEGRGALGHRGAHRIG